MKAQSWFLATGLSLLLILQLTFGLLLATPNGVRLASPAEGQVGLHVELAGDAWFAGGTEDLASIHLVARGPKGENVSLPMERIEVMDGLKVLYPLARWRGAIDLPSPGSWNLTAVATSTANGGTAQFRSSTTRTVIAIDGSLGTFERFGPQHLWPVLLVVVLSVTAFVTVRRRGALSPKLAWTLSLLLWGNELFYQSVCFAQGGWSLYGSLMLQVGGLTTLLIPFALLLREGRVRRQVVELVWFWGIGGATVALLTTDLGAASFPSVHYFCFFLSHGLILISACALAGQRPQAITVGSLVRVLIVSNLVLLPLVAINFGLTMLPPHDPGNYFVLTYPPPEGSPVDLLARVFGPSPGYVLGLELLAIAVFVVLWLPFALSRRLPHREHPLTSGRGYVAVQFVLLGAAAVLPFVAGSPWGPRFTGWELQVGVLLGVASLVLTWDAVTVLGSNLSALPRPLETSALVRRGPYRLLRHPIYTSLLGALTGWTLVWKDVGLVALALTLLVLFLFKSRLEERWLLQRYPEYEAYRAETGGLFPRVF